MKDEEYCVRFPLDFFDDARVKVIEAMPSGDTIICLWIRFLFLRVRAMDMGCGWGLPPPLRGRQDAHRGGAVPDHPQPAAGHTLRPVGAGPVRCGPFGDGRGRAMKLTWVKFHLDFFDDPRVKVIETMRSPTP